jgi:GntR family transcriptional regulator
MADPRWRQIADDLRARIDSGELGSDGSPLPTELELQELYGAARNTVRDAVRWLATRGLIYTRSGQGTFVTPKMDPFVTVLRAEDPQGESTAFAFAVQSRGRRPDLSVPRVEIQAAAGSAAAELELPAGASVVSRHQRRLVDGVPYSLQTTFYPMELVERGAVRLIQAKDIAEGAVHYLERLFGFTQTGWVDRITVRAPDTNETAFFSLPDDGRIGVFELVRTGFDDAGRPFRVTVTTLPTDRNEFVLQTGQVPDFTAGRALSRPDDSAPARRTATGSGEHRPASPAHPTVAGHGRGRDLRR